SAGARKTAASGCRYNWHSWRREPRFRRLTMAKLDGHPTVVKYRQGPGKPAPEVLDAEALRRLCLEAGADDVGFVAIGRPELHDQRPAIRPFYPRAKAPGS